MIWNEKNKKIIIGLCILGVALICLPNFSAKEKSPPKEHKINEISIEEYRIQIEKNLKDLISSIENTGNVKVLVTLESSAQNVYATEQKQNKETENTSTGENTKTKESDDCEIRYITIKDSNGAEKALSVTQMQPKIKGVVVVCDGGNDTDIQQRITDAVITALNITSKRVYVTK